VKLEHKVRRVIKVTKVFKVMLVKSEHRAQLVRRVLKDYKVT